MGDSAKVALLSAASSEELDHLGRLIHEQRFDGDVVPVKICRRFRQLQGNVGSALQERPGRQFFRPPAADVSNIACRFSFTFSMKP
jgi:hypothetical protein